MQTGANPIEIVIPIPHEQQGRFIDSPAKRKVIKAGRRGGKTVGMAIYTLEKFLAKKRILYTVPTSDQLDRFWAEITRALAQPIQAGIYRKNETEHTIEVPGTENRIKGKTAWSPDMLRGDYADILIFDEWQMMNESAWDEVGAPMMLDTDGDAVFIFTPPSLKSRSGSKAKDPQHASKLYKKAKADTTGRWETFTFTSFDNPYLSRNALDEITLDMTALAYRQEVMAEDVDEAPGALWTRQTIEDNRVKQAPPMDYVTIAIDPSATTGGDEAGIIVGGRSGDYYFTLEDRTIQGSPLTWATRAVEAFTYHKANIIVAEGNNGGEMVSQTIHSVDPDIPVKLVHASRGKATRAEPVSALYERGLVKHVGNFHALEDEMCLWIPGDPSPNRMDALVWGLTELSRNRGNSKVARSIQG